MPFYQGIEFFWAKSPASDEQIAHVESLLGASLPDDYRRFLKTINGGNLHDSWIEVPTYWDDRLPVDFFYSVNPEISGDYIINKFTQYNFSRRVPTLIIPIGINHCENLICLSLRAKDYGHAYIWAPFDEWIDEEQLEQTEEQLYFLANSFDEMLRALRKGDRNESDA